MKAITGVSLAFILHASFYAPTFVSAATSQPFTQEHANPTTAAIWQSTQAEHVYGFPEIKHNKKGTLTLNANALTFTAKSGSASVLRGSVTAVSVGNQRVEIWGIPGKLLRMSIPDGGGSAAAAVMHHRVDLLTVEFNDNKGGKRSAVFFLPANEAEHALQNFALAPTLNRQVSDTNCQNAPIEPKSVLVSAPDWSNAEVPAAYRALVYEHLIERLQHARDVEHVYRDGENDGRGTCPEYTVHISIVTFKQGDSVKRAALGSIGEFVGTTQMKFDVTITDASGKLNISKQITATMRGETEDTDVADQVAKTVAKRYVAILNRAEKSAINTPKA
ncbi:hypothetical protein [Tunturiibacter lichenicola]|uniref:hypothetical protein n=1 Tax=Tunturiibacter lichenicola TaxID=2051959 RepID=UPI0021B45E2E|nr:hypothetical protein [Edaphobacter lichenicola]